MGSEVLPSVDAVTAVRDKDGKVILLGVREAVYDRRTTQHEALLNSHHMRSHGVEVNDVTRSGNGEQCIKVKYEKSRVEVLFYL